MCTQRTACAVGDTVAAGTVAEIVRTEPNGSQLLATDTGRVGVFGVREVDTVWSDELLSSGIPCESCYEQPATVDTEQGRLVCHECA